MKKSKKTSGFRLKKKDSITMLLFILPFTLFILVFSYLPMFGLIVAFKDDINLLRYDFFEAFSRASWTLRNFTGLFDTGKFLLALKNTLIISVLKICILFPLPIFIAIMLTELKNKYLSKGIQAIIFLPHFLSWAIVYGIFKKLFDPTNGAFNSILAIMGASPVDFLGDPSLFWGVAVFTAGWKEIGWNCIVYVAAISAIDTSFYEAAKIDGASKMRQIVSITLPSILSTIAIMFILRLGSLMDAGFEQIFLMKNPSNQSVAEIIGTYTYSLFLDRNYSLSTAIGFFNSVVALVLVVTGNFIVRKVFKYSIW